MIQNRLAQKLPQPGYLIDIMAVNQDYCICRAGGETFVTPTFGPLRSAQERARKLPYFPTSHSQEAHFLRQWSFTETMPAGRSPALAVLT